jgi:hypothetical protein
VILQNAAWIVAVALLLGSASPGHAGVVRVPTDFVALPNAIVAAAPGDTVRLAGNGGSTYIVSNLSIAKNLTIEGGWRIDFQVRDPRIFVSVLRDTTSTDVRDRPVVRIIGAPTVTFDGVEIRGGRFGILAEEGADLRVRDCRFVSQKNARGGLNPAFNVGTSIRIVGGSLEADRILVENVITGYSAPGIGLESATATIRDSRFYNLQSLSTNPAVNGGAIFALDSQVLVQGSEFDLCQAIQGGGTMYAQRSTVDIVDCVMTGGLGGARGGALSLFDCPSVRVSGCRLEGNRGGQAGGIAATAVESLVLENTRFEGNHPLLEGSGGALQIQDSAFSITGCHFERNWQTGLNTPVVGGGGTCLRSTGTVTGTTFVNESAAAQGGAWSQVGGDVTFVDTRFDACQALAFGGAISIEQGGQVTLRRCLVNGCEAQYGAGVSAGFTADILLDRCTIVACIASSAGAALYVDTSSEVVSTNSILALAVRGDLAYCGSGSIDFSHTDAWNDDATNPRTEYSGECGNPTGTDGNVSVDPAFCPGDPDYRIQDSSPLKGTASDGGDPGWLPGGCPGNVLSIEKSSWGRIKAGYRVR